MIILMVVMMMTYSSTNATTSDTINKDMKMLVRHVREWTRNVSAWEEAKAIIVMFNHI